MPKKPPALCMFCGDAPCTCSDSVKPRPSARKTKPGQRERSAPPVAQATPEVAPGGADSFSDEVIPTKTRVFKLHEKARDLSFESAQRILLLSGILHPSDAALVRDELDPPKSQDIDRRTAEWRARHG